MNIYEELCKIVSEDQILKDEPMGKHTTFRAGGKADYLVMPSNEEQVRDLVLLLKKENVPYYVMGNGSNLLVRDQGFKGVIIQIARKMNQIRVEGETIYAQAGALLSKIAAQALGEGLTGFEFASGIPGTLGGAVKMNAGAYGSEMKNIVVSTRYIDLDNDKIEIKEINNAEHEFSYRHSIFSNKNAIIIDTTLRLQTGNKDEIEEKLCNNLDNRREKQPIDKPSAGSTFKRGKDFITAQLIDECGLKGYTVGGAQVSEKHAGFVVNIGNATAKDVIELTEYVKKKVYEKFNKKIELEIEIV